MTEPARTLTACAVSAVKATTSRPGSAPTNRAIVARASSSASLVRRDLNPDPRCALAWYGSSSSTASSTARNVGVAPALSRSTYGTERPPSVGTVTPTPITRSSEPARMPARRDDAMEVSIPAGRREYLHGEHSPVRSPCEPDRPAAMHQRSPRRARLLAVPAVLLLALAACGDDDDSADDDTDVTAAVTDPASAPRPVDTAPADTATTGTAVRRHGVRRDLRGGRVRRRPGRPRSAATRTAPGASERRSSTRSASNASRPAA